MRRRRLEKQVEGKIEEKIERLRVTPGFTHIHLRHILTGVAAVLILLTTVSAFKLHNAYARYATIVDGRLDQQMLQRHTGIYAAPRRVSVEQQISQDELRERLLRAGYQQERQEKPADQFSSGSFIVAGDTVRLSTNESARSGNLPEAVKIKFSGKAKSGARIVNIEDVGAGKDIESITLPPELIAMDGGGMYPISFAGFEDFPPVVVKALIAIEDRHFFSHSGVDGKAICRAMWENWRHGGIREGGSTITQQLIKTSFLTPERTYERKFQEAMMAMALEQRLSKEEIFTLYANRVYLGQSGTTAVYGFKQAARVFFDKDLPELSLAESALIAGLVQAPNRYSPYLHADAATARRNTVLDAMVETGEISAEEAEAAKSEELAVVPPAKPDESVAQHFIDYAKRELSGQGVNERDTPDLNVQTTLDLDLQRAANIAVKNHLAKLDRAFSKRANLPEAALIAIDPHTGEILAMVGGRDYAQSQLNRVTDARRQPGSVFKPIVYAAALTHGISAETTFNDAPQEFVFGHEIYHPENYGGRFSNRTVTLREGIIRSLNVVAVDAAMRVGLPKVAEIAERMGLPRPEAYPSMALGAFEATPFEIAQAYSTFANNGARVTPFAVKAITRDGMNNRKNAKVETKVFGARSAYTITETLADVVNRGTAARVRGLGYRGPAAGKTGSSRDAWFVGYTPKLLAVVWVGFDDHRDVGMTGAEAAVPIWTDFIKRALALRPDLRAEKFAPPSGTELVEIDPETGMLATEDCPSRKLVVMDVAKTPLFCSKHQPGQVRPAGRKSYSVLANSERQRSVRRARPARGPTRAGNIPLQPLSDEDGLAPELRPVINREEGEPLRKKADETRPPVASPAPSTGQKPEIRKEAPPGPNRQ